MDERTLRVYLFHQPSKKVQYVLSILAIAVVIGLGMLLHDLIGYQVVALMLLLAVSMLAIFLDIVPVLIAALLSAVLWNFLFIPPRFTFAVGSAEDRLLLLMYFVIALINAVLTYKIKQVQKEVRRKKLRRMPSSFTIHYSIRYRMN